MQDRSRKATRLGALAYTAISLAVALAFYLVATALGKYTSTAVFGGTAWVFLLTMIVTMPTVTPWVKSRLNGTDRA